MNAPDLEGVTIDGRLAVLYSRFDLGNGWEQFPHPYSYGLKDQSALQIGTNMLVYATTHRLSSSETRSPLPSIAAQYNPLGTPCRPKPLFAVLTSLARNGGSSPS